MPRRSRTTRDVLPHSAARESAARVRSNDVTCVFYLSNYFSSDRPELCIVTFVHWFPRIPPGRHDLTVSICIVIRIMSWELANDVVFVNYVRRTTNSRHMHLLYCTNCVRMWCMWLLINVWLNDGTVWSLNFKRNECHHLWLGGCCKICFAFLTLGQNQTAWCARIIYLKNPLMLAQLFRSILINPSRPIYCK